MDHQMMKLLTLFAKEESGATAIEYSLIAAGIALAIVTAVNSIGPVLSSKFSDISTSVK